jgi:hypothetical protein
MYWKVENENKERRKRETSNYLLFLLTSSQSSLSLSPSLTHTHTHQRYDLQMPPKLLFFDQQFSTSIQHCPKIDFNIIPNAVSSKITPDVYLLAVLIRYTFRLSVLFYHCSNTKSEVRTMTLSNALLSPLLHYTAFLRLRSFLII